LKDFVRFKKVCSKLTNVTEITLQITPNPMDMLAYS